MPLHVAKFNSFSYIAKLSSEIKNTLRHLFILIVFELFNA